MRRLVHTGALLALLVTPTALAQKRECLSDLTCPPGKVCVGDEKTTKCEPRTCEAVYDPVCGLDGANHLNACSASLKRVGVAYPGPCGRCGGELDRQCGSGSFCDPDPGTCKLLGDGTCTTAPGVCPADVELVCGCDGRTYPNDCLRRMARVPLLAHGPCIDPARADNLPATASPAVEELETALTAPPVEPKTAATPPPATVHAEDSPAQTSSQPPAPSTPCTDCPPRTCKSNADCGLSELCWRQKPGACNKDGECRLRWCDQKELKEVAAAKAAQAAAGTPWKPVCGCDGVVYEDPCAALAAGQSLTCESCTSCTP